jgi:hypothetical protein
MTYYYDSKAKVLHIDKIQLGSLLIDSDFGAAGSVDSETQIYRRELNALSSIPFPFATINGSGKFTVEASETVSGVGRKQVMEVLITSDDNNAYSTQYASISTDVDLFDLHVVKSDDYGIVVYITPLTSYMKTYKMAGIVI